jgi:hypothetical protein
MGFYAITLGFDLSSITKVNNTNRSVNQKYLTKFAKVSLRVILHNRKINVTMRGTDPFYDPFYADLREFVTATGKWREGENPDSEQKILQDM